MRRQPGRGSRGAPRAAVPSHLALCQRPGNHGSDAKLVTVPTQPVRIPHRNGWLHGDFTSSGDSRAVVVFAHGTGSSRFSPRNRAVAEHLQRQGLATLLLDLLTSDEEAADQRSGRLRFDVHLLAERLVGAVGWLESRTSGRMALGYFGASTGAAAAILAAGRQGHRVGAIVSRGGRPDLAQDALGALTSPTLLIVGGRDDIVVELNRQAAGKITCPHELVVVPGATHLFEEPGALDQVAELATSWFCKYLFRPA